MSGSSLCWFSHFDNDEDDEDTENNDTRKDNGSQHLSAHGLMGGFPQCFTSVISSKPYGQLLK